MNYCGSRRLSTRSAPFVIYVVSQKRRFVGLFSTMSKDFDKWNSEKKRIHDGEQNKLYHEREIWWIALGVNIGFEQDGTGSGYQRPAIILKGYSKHVCLIVPLTTSLKQNPYHIGVGPVDGKEAFAII